MQTLRQLGVGVIIAILSVILVIGGVFLSLAETLPPPSTPTQIPPTFPESFPTPTGTLETATVLPTETQTSLPTLTPTLALALGSPTTCTPPSGWIRARPGMAAFNARKHNPVIGAFARLVARGKTFKQAMTACMRELLVPTNTLVARRQAWDPSYTT